ncbi:MAG: adenylate kinase [Elusimicrobia bacterium]|nr:adenylate kinase [Elusimicrobiota bacterium]
MRIVLLGCPGAGKGTQSKILAERYGLEHVATGDLFRAEIAAKSPLGLKVENYLKSGTLVPDATVVDLVASKLDGLTRGFLLDGFPRTLEQAQSLDKYLSKNKAGIDLVLYLNMNEKEVMRRLTSRRSCPKCGELYNVISRPPQAEGKCDKCGADLVQRPDDSETTVKKRLMVYDDLTRPLVAYYRSQSDFHEVDGAQPVETVTEQLTSIVDSNRGAAR